MNNVKNLDFPVARVVFIVVSFLLGILDMIFLYGALGSIIPELSNAMSMFVALTLATIANFTALMWGYENGKNLATKSINKRSAGFFIGWVAIGLAYVAIRVLNLFYGETEASILSQILQMGILAISYIGTGTLIASSAREIFDAQARGCRQTKKKFDRMHAQISNNAAAIQRTIGLLDKYDLNYRSLNRQHQKIKNSISRAEKASMANIVGEVVKRHPEISPTSAHAVMDEMLSERRKREDAEAL